MHDFLKNCVSCDVYEDSVAKRQFFCCHVRWKKYTRLFEQHNFK